MRPIHQRRLNLYYQGHNAGLQGRESKSVRCLIFIPIYSCMRRLPACVNKWRVYMRGGDQTRSSLSACTMPHVQGTSGCAPLWEQVSPLSASQETPVAPPGAAPTAQACCLGHHVAAPPWQSWPPVLHPSSPRPWPHLLFQAAAAADLRPSPAPDSMMTFHRVNACAEEGLLPACHPLA